jgi:hypothetical protein
MKSIFRFIRPLFDRLDTQVRSIFVVFCVFMTTNLLHAQWVQTNGPYVDVVVHCLAVSGTNLFAGIWGGGVFLSNNNGTSWREVNSGLTYTHVQSLAVMGRNLFAGTHGGGVWKRPLSEMIRSGGRTPN